MDLTDEIDAALAEAEDEFGETVKIDSHELTAIVTGGGLDNALVAGGFYEQSTFSITVRKSVLPTGFVPMAGMLVEARSYDLRIPSDGITDNRAHWKIQVVARDVPR